MTLSRSLGIATATVARILRDCGISLRSQSEASALRAARVMEAGRRNGTYLVYQSSKSKKWIPAGSSYEYLRMQQLDQDKNVVTFDRCLDRIKYELNGKTHHYTPDLTVVLRDGTIRVEEIKPAALLADWRVKAKETAARSFYAASCTRFEMITEANIGLDAIKNFKAEGLAAITTDEVETWRKRIERERKTRWAAEKRRRSPPTAAERARHAARENARYHNFMRTATAEQLAEFRRKAAARASKKEKRPSNL